MDVLELEQVRVVARALVSPERLADFEGVVEQSAATLEGKARRLMMMPHKADDAKPPYLQHGGDATRRQTGSVSRAKSVRKCRPVSSSITRAKSSLAFTPMTT